MRNTFERESNWVAWKSAGCPPFEREPAPPAPRSATAVTAAAAGAAAMAAVAADGGDGVPVQGVKRRRVAVGPASAAAVASRHYQKMVSVPGDQMAGLKTLERNLLPSLRVRGSLPRGAGQGAHL